MSRERPFFSIGASSLTRAEARGPREEYHSRGRYPLNAKIHKNKSIATGGAWYICSVQEAQIARKQNWFSGELNEEGQWISVESLTIICPILICFIIHQIFSLARDWSKRVMWHNMPQPKLGNIRVIFPNSSDIPQFSKLEFEIRCKSCFKNLRWGNVLPLFRRKT